MPEQRESELLFPAEDGGFRSECFLTKAVAEVGRLVGLKKKFTPRGMRRTFDDLARLANVEAVVTKRFSGHRTERIREHYSSVQPSEQRESIGRLLRLVKPAPSIEHPHKGCSEGCSDPLKGAPTKSAAS
jgi:integrase